MDQSNGFMSVEKLDAARRQAAQAIRLFFDRGDEVAVHTLAAAAHQILSDLCVHAGIKRELEDSEILEEIGAKKEVLVALRAPQNFFKHADKDPGGVIRFHPFLSAGLLLYSVSYYTQLTQKRFIEGDILQFWFYLKHPDRAPIPFQDAIRQHASILDHNEFDFFAKQITARMGR